MRGKPPVDLERHSPAPGQSGVDTWGHRFSSVAGTARDCISGRNPVNNPPGTLVRFPPNCPVNRRGLRCPLNVDSGPSSFGLRAPPERQRPARSLGAWQRRRPCPRLSGASPAPASPRPVLLPSASSVQPTALDHLPRRRAFALHSCAMRPTSPDHEALRASPA
jgi:hypothetical protein